MLPRAESEGLLWHKTIDELVVSDDAALVRVTQGLEKDRILFYIVAVSENYFPEELMSEKALTTKIAVPLTPADRERLTEKAQHIGLSPATFTRMLIRRELNASEPVAA